METVKESKDQQKIRMSFYITQRNRLRLQSIPRGKKTALINKALSEALSDLEKKRNFDGFLASIRKLKPVKSTLSSEDMVRALREQASN